MKGIFSALLTSFNETGEINEQGIRELVRHNILSNHVDGLYVGGSTGENFLINTSLKKEIFRIVKDETKEDVALIAQIGSNNIYEAIELGHYVKELGYNAISAVTPYYYKFSFEEIRDYYFTLVNEVDCPLVVYSIPLLTGVSMSLSQFNELLSHNKIVGVKFTAPDFFLLERIRKNFPNKLIYSGLDEMLLSASVLGVDGAIGSTFNLIGDKAKRILKAVEENKISEAKAAQSEINNIIEEVLQNGLYPTLKELLELQGVHAGVCRKPFSSLTDKQKNKANEIYHKYFEMM